MTSLMIVIMTGHSTFIMAIARSTTATRETRAVEGLAEGRITVVDAAVTAIRKEDLAVGLQVDLKVTKSTSCDRGCP